MQDVVQLPWLCRRLRLARETLQLTLATVGEQMGVQRAYISNLELCRKEPKLSTVIRYADILGIDLATLFAGCPPTKGTRKTPSAEECRRILKRLGTNSEDLQKFYYDLWAEQWSPEEDGEWGLADELLWLDTLVKANATKWKGPVVRHVRGGLTAKQGEGSANKEQEVAPKKKKPRSALKK